MKISLKSVLKIFKGSEKGTVFPIVLIALLLMGLLLPPLLGLIGTTLVTGKMYENSSYELYAADAGVMDAIWLIQGYANPGLNYISDQGIQDLFGENGTDPCIYTLEDGDLNGKTVVVKIVRDGLGFIITSTATETDGSTTTIETRVQFPPPPPPIMMAVGALNGDLKINAEVGNQDKWVSIYANGDIYMIGSGDIYGNAYYTYGHSIQQYPNGGWFHGVGIETVELELVDGVLPQNPAVLGSAYIYNGNMSISQTGVVHELGPVYITGNLQMSADVRVELKGTVWVAGKIQINDTAVVYGGYDSSDIPSGAESLYSTYDDGDPYFMISDYSVKTGNAISVNGSTPAGYDYKVSAIMYAPYGDIYVGGNASIDGAVVGKTVTILGDSRLTFPLPFEPVFPEYRRMDINYWKIT